MKFLVRGKVSLQFSNLLVEADTPEEAIRNIENGELAMDFDTVYPLVDGEDVEVLSADIESVEEIEDDDTTV